MATSKILPQLDANDIGRFWSKVSIGALDDCWNWKGSLFGGYGSYKAKRRSLRAHRVAYFLTYSVDPAPSLVCHTCDNPACCNPRHLFIGTVQDNALDCKQKGRLNSAAGDKHGSRKHPESVNRGEQHWTNRKPELVSRGSKNGAAKLTEEQVRQIRSMAKEGKTPREITDQFPITINAVYLILSGRRWSHVL